MSMHSFDPEVAAEVGVVPAVIYQNIVFWAMRNAAEAEKHEETRERLHYHEGRWWTWNSIPGLARLYPYLTQDQVRRALEKLESAGLVAVGNFHRDRFNRAKWFSPLRQADVAKIANASGAVARSHGNDAGCTSGENATQSGEFARSYTDRNLSDSYIDDDTPAVAGPTLNEVAAARLAPKPTASKYRFQGRVIRLNEADFNRWQDSYQPLHLAAHLEELDAHLHSDATPAQRKGWFHYVSAILKKRATIERDKASVAKAPRPQRRSTVNTEPGKLYADCL